MAHYSPIPSAESTAPIDGEGRSVAGTDSGDRASVSTVSPSPRHRAPYVLSDQDSTASRTTTASNNVGASGKSGQIRVQPVSQTHVRPTSVYEKLGLLVIVTLVASVIAILGLSGFLVFLREANQHNATWHTIMVRGWATRAVSLSTLFVRTAIDAQAGVATAMCAALALETHGAHLADAAFLSFQRAVMPSPWGVMTPIWGSATIIEPALTLLATLLFITTGLLQFSSSVLLSDLAVGTLAGSPQGSVLAYDFAYNRSVFQTDESHFMLDPPDSYLPISTPLNNTFGWSYWEQVTFPLTSRMSTWTRPPSSFPAFAEYTEPPPSDQLGVDDTGMLLRAMLPYADTESRKAIAEYSGKAAVLDSRVSCQRPDLSDVTIYGTIPGTPWDADVIWSVVVEGSLSNSRSPERLVPAEFYSDGTPFMCTITLRATQGEEASIAVCQLQADSGNMEIGNMAGSLLSEFMNFTVEDARASHESNGTLLLPTWGPAYLVLTPKLTNDSDAYSCDTSSTNTTYDNHTYTGGMDKLYQELTPNQPCHLNDTFYQTDPGANDTSANLKYRLYVGQDDPAYDKFFLTLTGDLDLTLCYAAWDTQNIDIHAWSGTNRSEPNPVFQSASYNVSALETYLNDGLDARITASGALGAAYTFTDVLAQLGLNPELQTPEARGTLDLQAPNGWTPLPSASDARPLQLQPITQASADAGGQGTYSTLMTMNAVKEQQAIGNCTLQFLDPGTAMTAFLAWGNQIAMVGNNSQVVSAQNYWVMALPDIMISSFFLEALNTSGSTAHALASLITLLSQMAYYDQFPLYKSQAEAVQVFFVSILFPQRHRGLLAFLIVLFAHEMVVAAIVTLFLVQTRFTRLGNAWQTIAHLYGSELREVVQESSFVSDAVVRKEILGLEQARKRVQLKRVSDGDMERVSLVETSTSSSA